MSLTLADWGSRERTQQEIVAEINGKLRQVAGVRAVAIQPNSLGIRGGGQGLQFAVAGQNFAEDRQDGRHAPRRHARRRALGPGAGSPRTRRSRSFPS